MGSWLKTCGLSNLHIFAGTPVYVFVLEDARKDSDSDCYATSLFSPLLLPFDSKYNDYGGGENSGGPGFEPIMAALKARLIERDVGENQYHDIAVKRDAFNEELFFRAVHEDRLMIGGHRSGKPVAVKFTMFRKDIVDDILQNHTFEDYVGHGAGNCGYNNNYVRVGYQDYVADIRPLLDHIVSAINDFRSSGVNEKTERALFRSISLFGRWDDNRASQLLSRIDYRYSRLVEFRDIGHQLLADSSEANVQRLTELITEYFKGVYIDMFMHAARKTWIPGGHEGSQSTSGDELRFLYAATVRALDREDEEDEDDEDFICPKCGLENPTTTCGLNDCGLVSWS